MVELRQRRNPGLDAHQLEPRRDGIKGGFRELSGGVVGVCGGNAVLVRLAQEAAAHPFGGGESSVAARFFRSETARFALHPYAVLGTQLLRYEITE